MKKEELLGLINDTPYREAMIRPAEDANGWMIAVELLDGQQIPLTDDHDHPRVYHDLDQATYVIQELKLDPVRIIERF